MKPYPATFFSKQLLTLIFAFALAGAVAPEAFAAKRDLSGFKGKYSGTASLAGEIEASVGPAVIQFKTKSRNRAADVYVTASIVLGMNPLSVNSSYTLRSNGRATCGSLAPGEVNQPTLSAKYKTRKRRITALCPFIYNSDTGFVQMIINRRATKRRALLNIKHIIFINSQPTPIAEFDYQGSRRIKRK